MARFDKRFRLAREGPRPKPPVPLDGTPLSGADHTLVRAALPFVGWIETTPATPRQ